MRWPDSSAGDAHLTIDGDDREWSTQLESAHARAPQSKEVLFSRNLQMINY